MITFQVTNCNTPMALQACHILCDAYAPDAPDRRMNPQTVNEAMETALRAFPGLQDEVLMAIFEREPIDIDVSQVIGPVSAGVLSVAADLAVAQARANVNTTFYWTDIDRIAERCTDALQPACAPAM